MSTSITNTTPTSTPPSPPTSPVRKQKPTLFIRPTQASFYDSPDSARSYFSPCSSDSEPESDDESEAPSLQRSSYFKRLRASRGPPSLPPSGPLPAIPATRGRFPSCSSVSSGLARRPSGLSSVAEPFDYSSPNTPALAPPPPYGMPSAPTAPSTPYSPWSTASTQPRVDTALLNLESQLMTVLGGQAPQDLVDARKERDVLVVKVQKAYYRREELGGLRQQLSNADTRVKALEEKWLMAVLGGVEAMVGNIRAEMAPHVQEQREEEEEEEEEKERDECAVDSEEEDEILEVFEHKVVEPEVESPQVPPHEERRFIWYPSSSSFDSDSESEAGSEDEYDSEAEYDSYGSDHLSVPALLHSPSASSSEASASPIIPGGNDWAPFSASDGGKPTSMVVLRIAGVEMEMI